DGGGGAAGRVGIEEAAGGGGGQRHRGGAGDVGCIAEAVPRLDRDDRRAIAGRQRLGRRGEREGARSAGDDRLRLGGVGQTGGGRGDRRAAGQRVLVVEGG